MATPQQFKELYRRGLRAAAAFQLKQVADKTKQNLRTSFQFYASAKFDSRRQELKNSAEHTVVLLEKLSKASPEVLGLLWRKSDAAKLSNHQT